MLRVVATAALMTMAGNAYAGCANFIDGSLSSPPPLVEICFGSDCETTRQEFVCSTAESVFTEFSNGLRIDSIRDDKLYGDINGDPIPDEELATLKCRPLDDNPDACSPL